MADFGISINITSPTGDEHRVLQFPVSTAKVICRSPCIKACNVFLTPHRRHSCDQHYALKADNEPTSTVALCHEAAASLQQQSQPSESR